MLGLTLVFSISVGGVSVAQTKLEVYDPADDGGNASPCEMCISQGGGCSEVDVDRLDCSGPYYQHFCCKGGGN
ncbi:hypothetical protein [Bernardetia sp. MNP-M8]|uniref:hypothetical protein n=1 Tax=Bernardetia sp. MNP-M8 TaxID=3127470 RepID=UPI0030CBC331